MLSNKLTTSRIAKLFKPGRYNDGQGLWLQISRWRTCSWLFQFTSSDGRVRQFGLGPLHTISLREARELATSCRKQVREGIDPIEERKKQKIAVRLKNARAMTFAEAAQHYVERNAGSWRNAKHRSQWEATLSTYANPVLGAISVADIDTDLVTRALQSCWNEKPETAGRVRARIERVLDWAKTSGYRTGENPARWKGHLDNVFVSPRKLKNVRHHPALPYDEVADFLRDLRRHQGISAKALEIVVLTALRTSEVIGAKWSEIDLVNKLWVIPADRMKARREHRVPLTEAIVAILKGLPREADNSYVFIGGKRSRPLSNMAMLELLKTIRPGMTVHGFRSTFRDWSAERTNYPNHVVEMALAHTVGNKVEAAYRRGDLLEKRRRLMSEWSRYCCEESSAASILAFKRGSRNGKGFPL